MSVDKFGRHTSTAIKTKLLRGIPGQGFTLTQSGDFNIENKRLSNVRNPTEAQDASTKAYVDNIFQLLQREIQSELVAINDKIRNIEEKLKTLEGKV